MVLAHVLAIFEKAPGVVFRWGGIIGDAHIACGTTAFADAVNKHSEQCLNRAAYQVMCMLPTVLAHLGIISSGSLNSVSLDRHTP